MPADIAACMKGAGVDIPDRDLTIAEVETLWKTDRLRIVVLRTCGARFTAWYNQLQQQWQ